MPAEPVDGAIVILLMPFIALSIVAATVILELSNLDISMV